MAYLSWNRSVREVGGALASLDEVQSAILDRLTQAGFTDLSSGDLEVAGMKYGVRTSIVHFPIADGRYWEVVIAAGETEVTQNVHDLVVTTLEQMASAEPRRAALAADRL